MFFVVVVVQLSILFFLELIGICALQVHSHQRIAPSNTSDAVNRTASSHSFVAHSTILWIGLIGTFASDKLLVVVWSLYASLIHRTYRSNIWLNRMQFPTALHYKKAVHFTFRPKAIEAHPFYNLHIHISWNTSHFSTSSLSLSISPALSMQLCAWTNDSTNTSK